ncbi:hypothetical protein DRQ50_01430 [bacterium]|nr:MAG: hypothetical protein DRQ50_01430 [bacterium]
MKTLTMMILTLGLFVTGCSDGEGNGNIQGLDIETSNLKLEPPHIDAGIGDMFQITIEVANAETFRTGIIELVYDRDLVEFMESALPSSGLLGPADEGLAFAHETGDGLALGFGRLDSERGESDTEGTLVILSFRCLDSGTDQILFGAQTWLDESGAMVNRHFEADSDGVIVEIH